MSQTQTVDQSEKQPFAVELLPELKSFLSCLVFSHSLDFDVKRIVLPFTSKTASVIPTYMLDRVLSNLPPSVMEDPELNIDFISLDYWLSECSHVRLDNFKQRFSVSGPPVPTRRQLIAASNKQYGRLVKNIGVAVDKGSLSAVSGKKDNIKGSMISVFDILATGFTLGSLGLFLSRVRSKPWMYTVIWTVIGFIIGIMLDMTLLILRSARVEMAVAGAGKVHGREGYGERPKENPLPPLPSHPGEGGAVALGEEPGDDDHEEEDAVEVEEEEAVKPKKAKKTKKSKIKTKKVKQD
eukprot:gnl/Dysnectes_brevis/6554_a10259_422.p1 GENE.gnl/Dysnectes_brevis/6554_a10259_422~~gnl/Dysnectes_brevis/6554_a10259_422.p1  ORF type:complete len:296 (+),score=69.03 gnl/Dysnectes_brevis/6554_a10259_422:87-974(+)